MSGSTLVTLVFLLSLVILGSFKKGLETSNLRLMHAMCKRLKALSIPNYGEITRIIWIESE